MHETDTMQALCWNARALAVRHQPSSWKHRFNLHIGRELRIFGRFYVKKTWRVGSISRIRLAELFFGGFSADENSAANTANGAGLEVYTDAPVVTVNWVGLVVFAVSWLYNTTRSTTPWDTTSFSSLSTVFRSLVSRPTWVT